MIGMLQIYLESMLGQIYLPQNFQADSHSISTSWYFSSFHDHTIYARSKIIEPTVGGDLGHYGIPGHPHGTVLTAFDIIPSWVRILN